MSLVGLIVISLALGVLAWLAFLWSVKSGQYDDPEGPKYRMLDDEEDRPPVRHGPEEATARPGGAAEASAPPGSQAGDDPPRTPPAGPAPRQPPGRS